MTRKIKNLFKEKNYEIGDQKNRNSSLILNLIADDKWGIFADNEDSQFSILHYFSKFNNVCILFFSLNVIIVVVIVIICIIIIVISQSIDDYNHLSFIFDF